MWNSSEITQMFQNQLSFLSECSKCHKENTWSCLSVCDIGVIKLPVCLCKDGFFGVFCDSGLKYFSVVFLFRGPSVVDKSFQELSIIINTMWYKSNENANFKDFC